MSPAAIYADKVAFTTTSASGPASGGGSLKNIVGRGFDENMQKACARGETANMQKIRAKAMKPHGNRNIFIRLIGSPGLKVNFGGY